MDFNYVVPFTGLKVETELVFMLVGEFAKKKPPVNKPPVEIKRPTIDASMVGYIDNAIVGSEVRIRFDAAFNDAFPDRAEFVYAKCGCFRNPPGLDPNAPGPGPGPKNVNFQVLSFMRVCRQPAILRIRGDPVPVDSAPRGSSWIRSWIP